MYKKATSHLFDTRWTYCYTVVRGLLTRGICISSCPANIFCITAATARPTCGYAARTVRRNARAFTFASTLASKPTVTFFPDGVFAPVQKIPAPHMSVISPFVVTFSNNKATMLWVKWSNKIQTPHHNAITIKSCTWHYLWDSQTKALAHGGLHRSKFNWAGCMKSNKLFLPLRKVNDTSNAKVSEHVGVPPSHRLTAALYTPYLLTNAILLQMPWQRDLEALQRGAQQRVTRARFHVCHHWWQT